MARRGRLRILGGGGGACGGLDFLVAMSASFSFSFFLFCNEMREWKTENRKHKMENGKWKRKKQPGEYLRGVGVALVFSGKEMSFYI